VRTLPDLGPITRHLIARATAKTRPGAIYLGAEDILEQDGRVGEAAWILFDRAKSRGIQVVLYDLKDAEKRKNKGLSQALTQLQNAFGVKIINGTLEDALQVWGHLGGRKLLVSRDRSEIGRYPALLKENRVAVLLAEEISDLTAALLLWDAPPEVLAQYFNREGAVFTVRAALRALLEAARNSLYVKTAA